MFKCPQNSLQESSEDQKEEIQVCHIDELGTSENKTDSIEEESLASFMKNYQIF